MMPPIPTGLIIRILGGLAVVLALVGLWLRGNHFENQRDAARGQRDALAVWQQDATAAARKAAHHPKLGKHAVAEQIGLLGDALDTVRSATEKARADALAAKQKKERHDEDRRRHSDEQLTLASRDDRWRGDRYKRANRLRKPRPERVAGDNRGSDLPQPGFAAESTDRSSATAELDAGSEIVAIGGADFDLCTVNSRRILEGHLWAVEPESPDGD